ncbi:MAG TPA: hypothetical protein VNV66_06995 [Pilimelia sp.]|nr:hypothetical protein [Pilimelia sp.]
MPEASPTRLPPLRDSVRAALPAWLLARVLVFGALAVVVWLHEGLPRTGAVPGAHGLQVWDAAWYRVIAEDGYAPHGAAAVRFFPLLPLAGGALAWLTQAPVAAVLLILSWGFGLAFGATLHRLLLAETGDAAAARRAAWLSQLVPGANVLVLGYTEALAGFLAVAYFLVLRTRRRLAAGIPLGLLSGLVRPTGLLLALPAAVELWRPARHRDRPVGRLLVVAAAPLGTAGYLAWCWWTYRDPLLPYRVHTAADLRGGVVDVRWEFLIDTSPAGYPWPLVLALLVTGGVLLWQCARRLPAAYTVWSACGFAAAVTAYGFHSLPRYLAGLFPLLMVAALACRRRWAWYGVLACCLPLFGWVAYLNFTPHVVP